MMWSELQEHSPDWITVISSKIQYKVKYPNLRSAMTRVHRSEELPALQPVIHLFIEVIF